MTESESVALPLGDTPRAALILIAIGTQVKQKYAHQAKKFPVKKIILPRVFVRDAC
jgi:hypothetical protein